MQEKQADTEIKVKFKPFYGIRPGVYLTALYVFILLIILFLLLLHPGLKNPGAVLIVKTEPTGAAVRIDGVYRGVAGSKIPVSKGTHTIEAVMPGFEGQSAIHEIPARYFGSLFFPLRYNVEFTLKTSDPVAAFAYYASDYATWTFAGEPTASWQVPMSLSEGAYRAGHLLNPTNTLKHEMRQVLLAAAGFAVTKASVRDLIRAKILLDNRGNAPSPVALVRSISDIFTFLSENQNAAKWLSQVLPREQASVIEGSKWFKKQSAVSPMPQPDVPIGSQRLAGVNFIRFSSGFMISETPVSRSLFETFLDENPQWKEQQTDYFPQEITSYPWEIDKNYITGATWYAAQAFCDWMALRIFPRSIPIDTIVRLPMEEEWSIAAQSIGNMKNVGWEWCNDPYAPLQIAKSSPLAIQAVGSPERSLRGRQTANSAETRASLPPDLSSPIVTFRLAIAPAIAPTIKE